jgi:hypothetical protein
MLRKMKELPPEIDGVDALGQITREDYESVLKPLVEEAHREGRRIRFLYRFGPEFGGFTAGAVWQDFSIGLKHLRLFERCAVVTSRDWLRNTCHLMAPLVPSPFRVFGDNELQNAVEWLSAPNQARHLEPKLIPEKEVLTVQVTGPLSREDFDALSAEIDPWIEAHHSLRGIIIHAQRFPGWENLGSFLRHIEFVGQHHRKVRRVALSADGAIPKVISELANHFVEAELKNFGYDNYEEAIAWAAEDKKGKSAA